MKTLNSTITRKQWSTENIKETDYLSAAKHGKYEGSLCLWLLAVRSEGNDQISGRVWRAPSH